MELNFFLDERVENIVQIVFSEVCACGVGHLWFSGRPAGKILMFLDIGEAAVYCTRHRVLNENVLLRR